MEQSIVSQGSDVVTTSSVLLSVAKGVWGWDGKTKFALERVQFYGDLGSKYMALVDDVNAAQSWTDEFRIRRQKLRDAGVPSSPDPYPELPRQIQEQVQDSIRASVDYAKWWGWRS